MNHLGKSVTCALLLFFAAQIDAADLQRGAREYKLCAGCHGFSGEGNSAVGAPSLAGQQDWYLRRQLTNYQQKIRGSEEDEPLARAMATMSLALTDAATIDDLVAYIAALPPPEASAADSMGDAEAGQAHYASCAVCHGAAAQGNRSMGAPALLALSPWYQIAQLQNFRTGRRGKDSRDTYGQQMATMADVLSDQQAIRDVVAYIHMLAGQARE
jgi:cytochrome c oxidase subunit 2